jgi:cephalosporin hydroxylase
MSNQIDIHKLANYPMETGDPYLNTLYELLKNHCLESLLYCRFLYWLVLNIKPAVALEIGVEFGLASAHMCSAAKEYGGHVVGLDLHWHDVPGTKIPEHYDNYYFFTADSTTDDAKRYVESMVDKFGKIGVVYQDSSHHYAPSVREWDIYSKMLSKDAIWVCDDITPAFFEKGVDAKSMVAYFDERPGKHIKFPNILHFGNTIGVIYDIP